MNLKRWIAVLCLGCAIVLAGCQEKLENEQMENDDVKQPVTYIEDKEQEAGPVVVEIVDPQTLEVIHIISPQELGYETDSESYKKKIEQFAQQLARGTDTAVGLDKRMVLDKLDDNGGIIKGSPLMILKESELVERVLAASATGGKVEMPLYITESGYYLEDIPYLEDVVVASYTTYFNSSDAGRNKNIELSAKAINNVIVGSGDTFSFNTVVGPRDEENGYQPAPEIINKKLVMGIGGGICQTSSTLFNAVDQLPIKFVERHHHSLDVGYVPKGRDATVSYGGLDFRFQNTSDVPFLIKATYGKDSLTVEVRTSEKYKAVLKNLTTQ
ncbi:VanW family protein [Lysinibacillus sp. NPDC093210]|uniref:VanW family protein n=1 Tax=Lysinibacillus sp. NPDC093210 TaxID=3364133 RepID=UPI003825BEFD